jgi:hypothetical protein
MAACGYSVGVGADISLAANVTQSILGIRSGASFGLVLKKMSLGSRGSGSTAPTAVPLLVEVCSCTFATNGTAGTNNTAETVLQTYGRVLTSGMTAMSAWTAEPTVLNVLDEFALHVQQSYKEGFPLGEEFDCDLNNGFVIRVTNPTGNPTVLMRPMVHVERI